MALTLWARSRELGGFCGVVGTGSCILLILMGLSHLVSRYIAVVSASSRIELTQDYLSNQVQIDLREA